MTPHDMAKAAIDAVLPGVLQDLRRPLAEDPRKRSYLHVEAEPGRRPRAYWRPRKRAPREVAHHLHVCRFSGVVVELVAPRAASSASNLLFRLIALPLETAVVHVAEVEP